MIRAWLETPVPLAVAPFHGWRRLLDWRTVRFSPSLPISRSSPSFLGQVVSQLEQATPLGRVALYAKGGIWYDAVTSLANLRRENPQNAALMADWNELLKSVDLNAIAQEPIQSVFTPQE